MLDLRGLTTHISSYIENKIVDISFIDNISDEEAKILLKAIGEKTFEWAKEDDKNFPFADYKSFSKFCSEMEIANKDIIRFLYDKIARNKTVNGDKLTQILINLLKIRNAADDSVEQVQISSNIDDKVSLFWELRQSAAHEFEKFNYRTPKNVIQILKDFIDLVIKNLFNEVYQDFSKKIEVIETKNSGK